MWLNYWTLLAQEGGKQNSRPLLCQSKIDVSAVSDATHQTLEGGAFQEKHSPSPQRGEVYPENYIDAEKIAGERGSDINTI